MASTRTAWGRSLQPMSENGALAPPRAIRVAPSRIIRAQTSFGIMPAPGNASVPNGRSPLTASTASAAAMAAPPAIWSVRNVISLSAFLRALHSPLRPSSGRAGFCIRLPPRDRPCLPGKTGGRKRSPFHSSDRSYGVFHALCICVPESAELGLIEIGDVLADICHQLLELRRHGRGAGEISNLGHDRFRRAFGGKQAD